ncbi:MAG: hypothetical protein M1837_000232 [Sclerophora amabilis]|nr:MAG: hypothetical protein M1837_000232 [Sclerophora amabilis]
MPDLFHGDPVPLNKPGGFDLMKWLSGPPGHEPERVQPVVESVIKVLRTEMGVERLGGVGYCFGGKYVILNLKGPSALDVGFIAHPSFVESSEVRAIAGPLSIAAAETDTIFPAEKRRETEDILAGAEVQQPHQMTLYGGVEHGFAVRGDVAKKEVRFAKESAFHQAVRWFDEFLHLS